MKKIINHITIAVFISVALNAQVNSSGSKGEDAFFLDLGIVIEPKTGNEIINRKIKPPSEEVKMFVKKVPSGSIFMASTKELKKTLDRISKRIESLESAISGDVSALSQDIETLQIENSQLRQMIANLAEQQNNFYASTPIMSSEPSDDIEEDNKPVAQAVVIEENPVQEKSGEQLIPEIASSEDSDSNPVEKEVFIAPPEQKVKQEQIIVSETKIVKAETFNKTVYMSGVFAYQREDYKTALKHFLSLPLENVDQRTSGNVLYWTADCYYRLGNYSRSLEILQLVEPLIGSDKVDDALVLTGLVYRNMGDEMQALDAFNQVVKVFPESEYFKLAQMELRKKRP